MKRPTILMLVCSMIIIIAHQVHSPKGTRDALLLYNVEALASHENDSWYGCIGIGTVDCPLTQIKVEYMMKALNVE